MGEAGGKCDWVVCEVKLIEVGIVLENVNTGKALVVSAEVILTRVIGDLSGNLLFARGRLDGAFDSSVLCPFSCDGD